jgi:hypothetical protein
MQLCFGMTVPRCAAVSLLWLLSGREGIAAVVTGLRGFGAALVAVGLMAVAVPTAAVADTIGGAPAAACTWQLDTRLPLPVGFNSATVAATDGVGRFAGTAFDGQAPFTPQAVLWQGGTVSVLPAPFGFSSYAFGLNRLGDVVGAIFPDAGGPSRPVLWRGGQLIRLGTASPDTSANARDINDAGLIVGEAIDPGADNRAIAWSADTPEKFQYPSVPGAPSYLSAVNETGRLAGYAVVSTGTTSRATGVVGTLAAGLHALPDLGNGTTTVVYSAAGPYLAGSQSAAFDTESHATLWRDETATVLSKRDSVAWGVNSAGAAAGSDAAAGLPLVWVNGVEQVLPLLSTGPVATSGVAQVVTEDSATVGGWLNGANGTSRPVLWHCR